MNGLTIGLTIGGIIFGAIMTYVVSKYFFNKGIKKKSLTPYRQFSSRLFSKLDPELKKDLIVSYRNHKVDNLTQVQFLVANDGDVSIRDIIEPLRLRIPKENTIFSVSIIHIEPDGRNISYKIIDSETENIIEFNIPLLNPREFFVFKLLLQDSLPEEEKDKERKITYSFTITADDLQPKLSISGLPYSYYEEDKNKKYDWTGFWIGLIFGLLLTVIFGVIYSFKLLSPSLYLFSLKEFFKWETFGFFNVCIIILALIGIVFLLLTIIGIGLSILELAPNKKTKFKVPSKLRSKIDEPYYFEMYD